MRSTVYDLLSVAPARNVSEAETCLGVGAHAHYFDADQRMASALVDYLLHLPQSPAASGQGDDEQRTG